MAEKVCTPPLEILQELFDCPPEITQRDIIELLNVKDRLALAREEYESLQEQLVEMLILGFPMESGEYRLRRTECGLQILQGEVNL